MAATLQLFHLPLSSSVIFRQNQSHLLFTGTNCSVTAPKPCFCCRRKRSRRIVVLVGEEDIGLSSVSVENEIQKVEEEEEEEEEEPTPEDLEFIAQIKRVLELLKKNRDMLFNEVKLTVMIEDPREVERKRLLGIEDSDGPTREELADVLVEVNEGKVPRNRLALRLLAEEMIQWPNLEVEVQKKRSGKSLYAKVTDTGINPEVAAKRLNVDWDSAAEIEDTDTGDESEVPPAVGYGVLYLISAFPVIIGISVVLILFYNSLQ
ncbi:hypothetical protein Ddye_029858 [Dipteronia dyeriana]|uniref:Ycf3-interacting protein 1, chloroplastic n=1 Tax=Dipteronia dyeriana TaxID=168575 RepID=A0AAD9TFJ8_9ROSI|nr:hypothetical protein Ddye_029858 [Dipteronia dyeriana]